MNTEPPNLAAALAAAMERQGISQVDLAAATGIPRATLQRGLDHPGSFRVSQLDAVARALDLDLLMTPLSVTS